MRYKTLQSLFIVVASIISSSTSAQKLPNKQEAGMWAPATVKTDGSAAEWDGTYKAFNKSTGVYYSMANDNENLYLVIHADESRTIEKMMEGGISFTVTSPQKSHKDATILFPVMSLQSSWEILHNAGKTLTEAPRPKGAPAFIPQQDPNGIYKRKDSIVNAQVGLDIAKSNKLLLDRQREIKTMGIEAADTIAIKDPKAIYYRSLPLHEHAFQLVPLNNAEGIKAMSQFDDKTAYTVEFAVPLKYINFAISGSGKVKYSITINGRSEDERPGATLTWNYVPDATGQRHAVMQNQDLESATDFSGEYVLAKNP